MDQQTEQPQTVDYSVASSTTTVDDINDNVNWTIDDVLVNLKTLASVREYEKLCIRDEKFLDKDGSFALIQPIKRMFCEDNRKKTVAFIEKLIERAFAFLQQRYGMSQQYQQQQHQEAVSLGQQTTTSTSSKKQSQSQQQQPHPEKSSPKQQSLSSVGKQNIEMRQLINDLERSISGIQSIRFTYNQDSVICSKLNLLLEKIQHCINEYNVYVYK